MRNRWFRSGALACALTFLMFGCSSDDGSTPDGSSTGKDGSSNDRRIIQPDGQNCATPKNWYPDTDNDGYGSALAQPVTACTAPAGHVDNPLDCGDEDPDAHPGQTAYFDREINGETINKWDFNCDGQVETEVTAGAKVCVGRGYTICESAIEPGTWWGTKPPECGQEGEVLLSCSSNNDPLNHICSPNKGQKRTQRCR
ncbi:MAG: hypothetical protein KC503_38965 [Myxococcales bacterium]|nr:hypothetical protein [Myxococcales bacterium]